MKLPRFTLFRSQLGSPSMEMVLCTPLALLFLFVAIDGGLAFIEKAALSDALRSGLNTEGICDSYKGQLTPDGTGQFVVGADLTQFVQCVSGEIRKNIIQTRPSGSGAAMSDFKVTLQPVILDMDPQNGHFLRYRFIAPEVQVGSFDIHTASPSYPLKSKDTFVGELLSEEADAPVSRYASPVGVSYSATDPGSSALRFMPQSLLLYGEITALTRGINHSYVSRILGRLYALQKQDFRLLRSQLP